MSEGPGRCFLEETKYGKFGPSEQQQGRPQPPLYALLRDGSRLSLPRPSAAGLGRMPLGDAITLRRSLRTYAEAGLSLDELSFLLWATQGVKPESTDKYTLRTVPSAGARHAFETVLLVNRVEGLAAGLYQYDAAEHGLIQWSSTADISDRLTEACFKQGMIGACAAAFFWVADRRRMTWRYDERGFRYLFLDAGHVCQNLHLAAEAIGAGACAIGAFSDDDVNRELGLDGTEQFVVYVAVVGKRPSA